MIGATLRVNSLDEVFLKGRTRKGKNITHPIMKETLIEIGSVDNFCGALVGGVAVQVWLYPHLKNKTEYLRKTNDIEFIFPPRLELKHLKKIINCLEYLGDYKIIKEADGLLCAELNYDDCQRPLQITFYNGIEHAIKINRALEHTKYLQIPNSKYEYKINVISIEDIIASKSGRLKPKDVYDIQLLNFYYGHKLNQEYLAQAMDDWVDSEIKHSTLRSLKLPT